MISLKYFLNKVKDVKVSDLMAVFPMLTALAVSPVYKNKYKKTWLICEEPKEARDNGYWFFRKMCENHPEQHCIYAIDKSSVDYAKVRRLGEVIQYGSLRHWIIYFTCQHNISSQKGGKPNAALCSFIELNGFYNAHNVFLQHGITINNVKWLHSDCSKFDMIVAAVSLEKKFIIDVFGYKREIVKLTGFPRFDNLHNVIVKKNRIVIMPTWRQWFTLKSRRRNGLQNEFVDSEYLLKWRELLQSEKLNYLIDEFHLEVIFYPHRNMQQYLHKFCEGLDSKVKIAFWEDYDLQDLLKTSEMMITDYSSVFFDMIYMKKPVIFYQFDRDDFRKFQYEQGYFDYQNTPFGKSYTKQNLVLEELQKIVENGYRCTDDFMRAHKEYFKFYDTQNCERIFKAICET